MHENHETWHGVMTWHQHAAVIILAELGQALSFLQTGTSLKKARGSRGNVSPPCPKLDTYIAFSRLNFFTQAD